MFVISTSVDIYYPVKDFDIMLDAEFMNST